MRDRFEFFNVFADGAKQLGMTPIPGTQVASFPASFASYWNDDWTVGMVISAIQTTDETKITLHFARGGYNENPKTQLNFEWKNGKWQDMFGQRMRNQELSDYFFSHLAHRTQLLSYGNPVQIPVGTHH